MLGLGLGISIPTPAGVGQVVGFSPLDLSPVLWLDASDTSTITESGGSVSQWDDKSGNGNHVTQGTAANQPTSGTRTVNGLNVLDFDGSDFLTAGDKFDVLSGGITMMAVAEMDTTSGGDAIAGKYLANTGGSYLLTRSSADDKLAGLFYDSALRVCREFTTFTSTTAHVFGFRLRRDNASGLQIWRDGTFTGTSATVGSTSYDNASDFEIGIASSSINPFNGAIAELVVVQSDLSDSDMTALSNYLAAKWGITL